MTPKPDHLAHVQPPRVSPQAASYQCLVSSKKFLEQLAWLKPGVRRKQPAHYQERCQPDSGQRGERDQNPRHSGFPVPVDGVNHRSVVNGYNNFVRAA
jgi:hypothetical protein